MRFAIAPEHRSFFIKNRFIHFVDLISGDEAEKIESSAKLALAKRLKKEIFQLEKEPSSTLVANGMDLWREDPFLKKKCLQLPFAEIASNLFQTRPIRIAYVDFLLPGKDPLTIDSIFSHKAIQGVCGALFLQLETDDTSTIPCTKGGGLFVSSTANLSFSVRRPMLKIAYTDSQARYLPKSKDEEIKILKVLGYRGGELLKDATHPILFS